jgi:phage tail protein X
MPSLKDIYTGVRYYPSLKYPEIPLSETDIYIITVFGDRLDIFADHYYGTTDDSWIISTANGLSGSSIFFEPGTQLRIPTDTITIKNNFNQLNGLN